MLRGDVLNPCSFGRAYASGRGRLVTGIRRRRNSSILDFAVPSRRDPVHRLSITHKFSWSKNNFIESHESVSRDSTSCLVAATGARLVPDESSVIPCRAPESLWRVLHGIERGPPWSQRRGHQLDRWRDCGLPICGRSARQKASLLVRTDKRCGRRERSNGLPGLGEHQSSISLLLERTRE